MRLPNKNNRILIFIIFGVLLACLFPPFVLQQSGIVANRTWSFLLNPPKMMSIDLPFLITEIIIIGSIGMLVLLLNKSNQR